MGTRTYHEQHFFCAECGDPFLAPRDGSTRSSGELNVSGDGVFEDDDVGFTVYKGHPYCEACHVRLRLPKCKRCKKSIRDGAEAVEALGGKWCWECFTCAVSYQLQSHSVTIFYFNCRAVRSHSMIHHSSREMASLSARLASVSY